MDALPNLAKIQPPGTETACPRLRLFERLETARERSVVWLAAAAGYGKTTLVASYLAARDVVPLWYQFDEGDRDPAAFFHYLDLAARRAGSDRSLPVLRPEHLPGLAGFVRNAFRQLYAALGAPAALVFDNFQDLPPDAPLQTVLDVVFAEIPPGVSVLVISRREPPPILARLQANRRLMLLTGGELAFDRDETRELIACLGMSPLDESALARLQQRYHGWCAGIILALQRGLPDDDSAALDAVPPDAVFDYLANEVFGHLPEAVQSVLLATALLPQVSAEGARTVSGRDDAAALLAEWHQFISRPAGQPDLFQFHPLFREFLLRQGASRLDEETRRAMRQRAAKWLAGAGWLPEAARLYAQLGAYQAVSDLVREQAPALAARGRWGRLAVLLDCLPENERQSPWMRYWQAQVAMMRDLPAARALLQQALAGFAQVADPQGYCLAWAGLVETVILAWDDFGPLDALIDDMAVRLRDDQDGPTPEAAAKVAFGMFHALTYHRLGDPALPHWVAQVSVLMVEAPEAEQRVAIACQLVIHHSWMGDFAGAEQVLDRTAALAADPSVSDLQRIYWWHMRALMHWLRADFAASLDALRQAERRAAQSGVHVFDFILAMLRSFLILQAGDRGEVARQLERLHELAGGFPGRMGQAHYHYVAALAACHAGDGEAAHRHLLQSHARVSAIGIPFAETNCEIALARNLILLGRPQEARPWLAAARARAEAIGSRFLDHAVALLSAELARAEGDQDQADAHLREALALGRAGGYFHYDWWLPEVMLAHCLRALELGVEEDFVRTLIRRHRLTPAAPPLHLANWPWPVRIHSLGRFGVQVDDRPLGAGGQPGSRPLLLLKALVAFGGRDVPEALISEALWPDAEGDSAHNVFTTTLSRLRKLLGPDTLLVRNGRLSLNDRLCWLDAWAFERALLALEDILSRQPDDAAVVARAAERVFDLCGVESLANDPDEGWQRAQRERQRIRLMHGLRRLVEYHQQHSDCTGVIGLLERILRLDPYEEFTYRGLMRCYAGLGDRAEALAVYQRCRDLLQATFGIEPSETTTRLQQRILAAGPDQLARLCDNCRRPLARARD